MPPPWREGHEAQKGREKNIPKALNDVWYRCAPEKSRGGEGEIVMTQAEIIRGIEAYSEEQKAIIEAIRRHGGALTQDEFDEEFSEFGYIETDKGLVPVLRMKPMCVNWMDDDSFILGTLQSHTQRDRMLHLLQYMGAAGLVTSERNEAGKLVYREAPLRSPPGGVVGS
jgi:hypothetical protein